MSLDVVVFFHGLGNQMSQCAFYLERKKISKKVYYINLGNDHNGFELDRVFNFRTEKSFTQKFLYLIFRILLTDKSIIKPLKWLLKSLNFKIIKEGYNYAFRQELLRPSSGVTFYYGGWHDERYFSDVKDEVSEIFTFKECTDNCNSVHIKNIKDSNSVSVHIRRGDYLNSVNIGLFGGICTDNYYKKAVKIIESNVSDPHYYIFSNDTEWVFNNFNLKNMTIVNCNMAKDSWKDMYLMSLCKHNIIANSTFSWWGAWLNKNGGKIVVSPDRFINSDYSTDIYPSAWIKLVN